MLSVRVSPRWHPRRWSWPVSSWVVDSNAKSFEVVKGRCPKKEVRRDHATGNRDVHVPDSTASGVVGRRSASERTPAARVAVSPYTVSMAGSAEGTTTVAGSPGGIVPVHVMAYSSRL